MKSIKIFALALFYLASCSNRHISNDAINTTLPISIELSDCFTSSKVVFKLSEIANSISYVKLETTKESLLSGSISITPIENGYLIVDIMEASIFLFDIDGKFKWKINNKGRGPSEYLELSVPLGIDTIFKEIIIPDNRELVVYDFNGKFKRKLSIPFSAGGVHVLPSGYYVLWTISPFKTSLAHIIDREGRVIKNFPNYNLSKRLNEEGVYRSLSISAYNPYKDGLFVDNKDTIWLLDNSNSLNPWFIINSKVKNYTDRYYTYGYNVVNKSLIGFFFSLQRQYYLYNINTREFYSPESKVEDDIDFCLPFNLGSCHDNYIISTLSAISLMENKPKFRKDSSISKIASSIKEDDNPIIRMIKLKEQIYTHN